MQVPIVAGGGKEDWEECGYSIGYYETSNSEQGWGDMDIPEEWRGSERYRATLCHKMNHSFQNNCQFSDITHPLYGYLPCTVTTKPVSHYWCKSYCPNRELKQDITSLTITLPSLQHHILFVRLFTFYGQACHSIPFVLPSQSFLS